MKFAFWKVSRCPPPAGIIRAPAEKGVPPHTASVGVGTAARPNGKGEACGGEPFATADGSGSFIEGGRSAVMRLLPIYCNSGNRRFRVKIRFLIFSFDYLRLLDIFAAINHL